MSKEQCKEELRQLQNEASDNRLKHASIKNQMNKLKAELRDSNKEYNALKQDIQQAEAKAGLQMSEHALVRYLERCEGLDVKAMKEKVINEVLSKYGSEINTLGGGRYQLENGAWVVISGSKITSVLTEDMG